MWRGPDRRQAIDEEIRHHLQERVEKLVDAGMSEKAAQREARRRFGNVRRIKQQLGRIAGPAHEPGPELLGSFVADLRQGLRNLTRAPGFAAAVILTVGLGVGANTAVFSMTDAILFRPLPYDRPGELVSLNAYDAAADRSQSFVPRADARTWQREGAEAGGLTLYAPVTLTRTDGEDAAPVRGRAVSSNWLETLGARPAMGRSFSADEELPGADGVAVISTDFWRTQLGADPNVIGRTIELDQRVHTVVGVMGPQFKFPPLLHTDAWVPLARDGSVGRGVVGWVEMVARVPRGLTAYLLEERLNVVGRGIQEADPRTAGWAVRAEPFDRFRANSDTRQALWVVTGAVAIMLLIATVNAANLLLIRATTRQTDIAVRAALGASRGRLVRQQLTENLVLVAAGGGLAVALARLALTALVGLLPREVTFFLVGQITIDHRVLLAAMLTTSIVGVALALLPALKATGSARLEPASAGASASRGARRLRHVLVVAEVAMSVTLLVAAGLLLNSFVRLTSVDPGYDPAGLMQLSVELPRHSYVDGAARAAFMHRLRDRLGSLPDVVSATIADGVPPDTSFHFNVVLVAEGGEPRELPGVWLPYARVEPGFFETLKIPVVAGRTFTEDDQREATSAIIDRPLARFLYGEEDPVGRRFRLDRDESPWLTVVGVVEDVKLMGPDDRNGDMDLFYPLARDSLRDFLSVVVRTRGTPAAVMAPIRGVVRELDPTLPVWRLFTAEEGLTDSVDKPRFLLLVMVIFAIVALALAAIGTYGVLAFAVRQRNRELGVRVALGADSRRLETMVLREGMGSTLVGIGIGTVGAVMLARVARGLLFEVEPADPLTLVGVAALMLATAALACWVPARRATQVDPIEVLRAQ